MLGFEMLWLSNIIKETDNVWNTFPKFVFNVVGEILFFFFLKLKCNYKIENLLVKLSNSHEQALLTWKLIEADFLTD